MKVFDFPQYSDEYWAVRRGVPTASEMSCILTPKTMKLSAAVDTYICRLLGDVYDQSYPRLNEKVSTAMRDGTAQEAEARNWFSLQADEDVKQVGFCMSDCERMGCSPDGLTEDSGLELKNPTPAVHVSYLLDGKQVPAEYLGQVHASMLVTGFDSWWFMSYCPPLPALLVKVERGEYTDALKGAFEKFWERFQEAKARIEKMRPV
jgi:hypothetical protein